MSETRTLTIHDGGWTWRERRRRLYHRGPLCLEITLRSVAPLTGRILQIRQVVLLRDIKAARCDIVRLHREDMKRAMHEAERGA